MELAATGMTDRQRRYRANYRERVAGWYNGWLHVFIIYAIGFTALYVYLSNLSAVTPLEWLTVPLTFRKDRTVRLGAERVRVDLLAERVRQLMDGRADKKIYLRGDGGITLQELLDIMDRLSEAGIQQMGIIARLPEER